MNGVTVTAQMSTDELWSADAVIVGSGNKTRDYAADEAFLVSLRLDPARQLVGSQCSGALLLAKLGLLANVPVCTDLTTKPWVIEAGVNVVDRPFYASGNVATAGGCLSAQYRCVDHHPNRRCRRGPQRIVLCCAGWRKRPVHRPSDGTRAGRQRRGRRRFG